MAGDRPFGEVQRSHVRLQRMLDEVLSGSDLSPVRIETILQEVSAALEELRVADEELTVQGEQLAASADTIDAERRRYTELFDFAPDGYVETDEMGKVVEANQAAGLLLGVAPRLLVGRLLVSFVEDEARRSFRRLLTEAVEGGAVGERVLPLRDPDGEGRIVGITVARALAPEADGTRLRWLARDISDRVKLEQQVELLSDEVELLTGLSEVQRLVEGPDPLAATLQGLVEMAHRSLPGCEVGISLVGRDDIERQVGSGARARELDVLQREAGAGPCIEALAGTEVVRGDPHRWPVLGPADDITEVVALPLVLGGEVRGALNVYSMETVLDDRAVRLLALLAAQAAVALRNAHLFTSSAGLAAGLAEALEHRGTIERAKGILMAEQRCDADAAFDMLRRASQRENVKLHLVASRIAVSAERRAGRPSPG